jgi:hypothetical protein
MVTGWFGLLGNEGVVVNTDGVQTIVEHDIAYSELLHAIFSFGYKYYKQTRTVSSSSLQERGLLNGQSLASRT